MLRTNFRYLVRERQKLDNGRDNKGERGTPSASTRPRITNSGDKLVGGFNCETLNVALAALYVLCLSWDTHVSCHFFASMNIAGH